MLCAEPRGTAIEYVKALDAYVANSFLLKTVSESITDGININPDKASALIRSNAELSDVIFAFTGAHPLDVGEPIEFHGLLYDGTSVKAPVEEVRKVVRQALLRPQSLAEYEVACLFYYCSRHGLCAEQIATESAA